MSKLRFKAQLYRFADRVTFQVHEMPDEWRGSCTTDGSGSFRASGIASGSTVDSDDSPEIWDASLNAHPRVWLFLRGRCRIEDQHVSMISAESEGNARALMAVAVETMRQFTEAAAKSAPFRARRKTDLLAVGDLEMATFEIAEV